MIALNMPRLSDSMEEGTLIRWLVADGSDVRLGDELAEIETDKAIMPLEAVADGRLHIQAEEGSTLPVGSPLAWVLAEGEELSAGSGAPTDPHPQVTVTTHHPGSSDEAPASGRNGAGNFDASPIARRTASRLEIDLAVVIGSGPRGRIMKRDVVTAADLAAERGSTLEATVEAVEVPAVVVDEASAFGQGRGSVETVALTSLQRTVARRMLESKSAAPDFTVTVDVDMESAMQLRQQLRDAVDPAPSVNDFAVKAMALALRRHPDLNASFDDGYVRRYSRINIGVAVAGSGTLLVPTVFDADRIPIGTIAAETRRLAELARGGRLTVADMSDSTATVSNLGMFGVREFVGVLNPPETVILAVGAVEKRAVVVEDAVVPRQCMTLTATFDHRVAYGVDGAEFLSTMRGLLESPLALLT